MRGTKVYFSVVAFADLIGRAHLRIRDTADHKYNETLSRWIAHFL